MHPRTGRDSNPGWDGILVTDVAQGTAGLGSSCVERQNERFSWRYGAQFKCITAQTDFQPVRNGIEENLRVSDNNAWSLIFCQVWKIMAIKGSGNSQRKRIARIVSLVLSAMKNIRNEDGCTIGNIVDYITDIGCQSAPKREVVAALKRSVEFGIMKKRRGRYFLRYKGENVTKKNKKVEKYLAMEKALGNSLASSRPVRRKIRRKKRRGNQIKSTQDRRSLRKRAINRSAKSRRWRSTNSNKFFELYVNPRCRVSAKSSLASTQMLVQEETENCT